MLRELRRSLSGRAKGLSRRDENVVLQVALDFGLDLLADNPLLHLGVGGQQAPLLSNLVRFRNQRHKSRTIQHKLPSTKLAMRDKEIAAAARPFQIRSSGA
ncbi:MAG: hypothetical protein HRU76_01335 [Phycisphaeraceae bacterium]|nr:MAG: hypothetical protein HRU76_01335 [Phycisphaeraceae bacterium]